LSLREFATSSCAVDARFARDKIALIGEIAQPATGQGFIVR
jgi:hypothetical protein